MNWARLVNNGLGKSFVSHHQRTSSRLAAVYLLSKKYILTTDGLALERERDKQQDTRVMIINNVNAHFSLLRS